MRSHLDPSELGTKQYWDEAYAREIANHAQDAQDEGTIWFDDSGAEEKVVERLEALEDEGLLSKDDSRILDLGTGNGHMLFSLLDEEWSGELVGVDYSDASVKLARQIAAGREEEDASIRFDEWDLLNQQPGEWLGEGFDATDAQGRRICESYREHITPLIKPGQFFIITSCNWTKEEVMNWFVAPDGELQFFDEAKYPTFTFGGQQGQSVCTLIFQRRSN
ncbi:unnamed protein product [Aureobasidium pullulans]|nr:unnamed protein product [Aureobasidium pullulans]